MTLEARRLRHLIADIRSIAASNDRVAIGSILLTVIVTGIYAVLSAIVRPSMFSDSGVGFLVWDAMRRGAPFNYAVFPDWANIATNTSVFFTTWAPAQYLLPGVLELSGMSLGVAIVVVVVAFSLLGLAGWFTLYRACGFPLRSAAVALAIIACSRHFALPFGIYTGGELLMFGALPWFLLAVWSFRDLRWRAVPLLVAMSLLMIACKLSGLLVATAAIGAAALGAGHVWHWGETIRRSIVAAAVVGLTGLVFYLAWFSRGWNVVSETTTVQWSQVVPTTAYVLTSVWTAMFSLGEFIQFVFFHPSRTLLASVDTLSFFLLLPALGTFAFTWRQLAGFGEYRRFAFLGAFAFATVMIVLWIVGGAIDRDDRYFRPFSLLLLVGVVHAVLTARSRAIRIAFAFFAGVMMLYGVSSSVRRAEAALHEPLGSRGFRHQIASAPALKFIASVDAERPDGSRPLVFVPSPEIGLELQHSRVLSLHADFVSPESLRTFVIRGRVPQLYILLQKRLVDNGKADIILNCFADYRRGEWKVIPLGDFVAFVAGS